MLAALRVSAVAVLFESAWSEMCPDVVKKAEFAPSIVGERDLCIMHKPDTGMALTPDKIDLHGESSPSGDNVNKDTCESDAKGSDEFRVGCSRITLSYDGGVCACKYMNIRKRGSGDSAVVTARLDFESCTTGPPLAVLNMSVKKVPDDQWVEPAEEAAQGSIADYMRATCGKPTTTQVQSSAKLAVQVKQQALGKSTCKGTILQSHKVPKSGDNEKDRTVCQNACMGLIEKFAAMGEESDQGGQCTGYAFSQDAEGDNCLLYKGKFTTVEEDASKPGSWNCWNMTGTHASFQESTPAPMSDADKAALAAKAPKLAFTITAETAMVATVTSKIDGCFSQYSWIDLKDRQGAAGFFPVKASEWGELLEFIPSPQSAPSTALVTSDSIGCSYFTREIYFGAANGGSGGLVGSEIAARQVVTAAPAPCPTVQDCTTAEYIDAAITAICTALLTWVCVYIVYDRFLKKRSSSKEQASEEFGGCEFNDVLILCLLAAVVAGISASLFSHLLGFLLTPICASSSHDLNLITEASSMAAFAAIAVAVFWISTRKSASSGGEESYMLIKVKDGGQHPMHPVIMKSQIVEQWP